MALLGKILLFFNLLAAIGFFVLSGLDWGKRTDAQYQVFHGDLIVNGLPLDDKDPHFLNPADGPLVKQLTPRALAETVSQGGPDLGASAGSTVKTLHDEVTRVQGLVKSKIDGATDPAAKAKLLRQYLLDQMTDGTARDDVARRLAIPGELDKLAAQLNGLFDEAANRGVPASPYDSPKTEEDTQLKREQIAHLLIFLDPQDEGWQKRVAGVVGLKTYNEALARQAAATAAMADRARLILRRDQNNFLGEYQALVAYLKTQADRLADAERRLATGKALLNEHALTASDLKKRVAEWEQKLAAQRAKTSESLTQQAGMERQIYEVLADIVRTQDAIRQTERRLGELEQPARPAASH